MIDNTINPVAPAQKQDKNLLKLLLLFHSQSITNCVNSPILISFSFRHYVGQTFASLLYSTATISNWFPAFGFTSPPNALPMDSFF